MPFTDRLGRFKWRTVTAAGLVVPSTTVSIFPRGASVNGNQSGGPGNLTVTVISSGALPFYGTLAVDIYRGDTHIIAAAVGTMTDTTVQLTGLATPLTLNDDDRIVFQDGTRFPTMWLDATGTEQQVTMPLTDSRGEVSLWMAPGLYDVVESGPVATKVTQDVVVGNGFLNEIWVTDARFGAKFDGTTDDLDALNGAQDYIDFITAGSGVQGGIIHVPAGIAKIRAPFVLDNRAVFRGQGARATEIQPTAGFTWNGTTAALVQLGPVGSASNLFSTRVEEMSLNCLGQTNSIGLYSDNANEGSGWHRLLIRSAHAKGVFLDGSGAGSCRNLHCSGLEVGISSNTGIGVHLKDVGERNTFNDITVSAAGTTPSTSKGVFVEGSLSRVNFNSLHVEFLSVGVDYGVDTFGTIDGVTGTGNTVAMIRLNDEGQGAFNISPAGASAIIIDNSGLTGNTTPITSFDGSFYYIGAAHADAKASVWTDFYSTGAGAPTTRSTQILARVHARKEFLGQLTFKRQTIAVTGTNQTIDATTFANNGFVWRLTGTAASVSNITTDASDDSRLLIIKVAGGNTVSVVGTGNIILLNGDWVPADTNEHLVLLSDGSNFREIGRSFVRDVGVTQTEALTSTTPTITVNNNTTYLRLTRANGAFGSVCNPSITYNSAFNGRTLQVYIENNDTTPSDDIQFLDASPYDLDSSFTIANIGKAMLSLVGDGTRSLWHEVSRKTLA